MCVSPIILKDEKRISIYATNKVPCGKCYECMQSRQISWLFRLINELKVANNAYFITLTYDDECLTFSEDNQMNLDYKDVQRFHKKYRSAYKRKFGINSKLKYFAVGEYGEKTQRPHYHIIAFNIDLELYLKTWEYGHTHSGTVTENSIMYTLKYCLKRSQKIRKNDLRNPEKALISRGIGVNFLTKEMIQYFQNNITRNARYKGKSINLPRYYRDKIFNDGQKKARYHKILDDPQIRELDERFKYTVIDKNQKLYNKLKETD